MGIKTGIEWCDSTVNAVIGCKGCELWSPGWKDEDQHCYAATLCKRWAGKGGWPMAFDQPEYFQGRLEQAINWRDLTGTDRPDKPWLNGYPRLVFLNDLSDTFISDPDPVEWLTPHIPRMAASPHIWLFLTKRPHEMYNYFKALGYVPENFWLGTSVTKPEVAARAEYLLKIRSFASDARLWISGEPLLGDIVRAFTPAMSAHLAWMVAGGESGTNARPCHPNWARALREWSLCWGIPFFWKQWGEWLPVYEDEWDAKGLSNGLYDRVGKNQAGRLLDGREWSEVPEWTR